MRKYAAVAAAAAFTVFVSHSAAEAVDITYYNASEEYARQIGRWYEEAPAALKARMYNAKVILAGDVETFVKVRRHVGDDKQEAAKWGNGFFIGVATQGRPGTNQVRSITFFEPGMKESSLDWQKKAVIHEMMHLFDMGPAGTSRNKILSMEPAFLAAYEADKRDYEAWLLKLSSQPDQRELLKKRLGYFFSKPQEAFAEAGALLISPGSKTDTGYQADFDRAFKRVNVYMKGLLQNAGIIPLYEIKPEPRKAEQEPPRRRSLSELQFNLRRAVEQNDFPPKTLPQWMSRSERAAFYASRRLAAQ